MAARKLRKFHTDEIRQKIQASQLVNRLTDHAFGNVDLTATQIKAIEVLLRKSVPDLAAVQIEGPGDDGQHFVEMQYSIVRPEHSDG